MVKRYLLSGILLLWCALLPIGETQAAAGDSSSVLRFCQPRVEGDEPSVVRVDFTGARAARDARDGQVAAVGTVDSRNSNGSQAVEPHPQASTLSSAGEGGQVVRLGGDTPLMRLSLSRDGFRERLPRGLMTYGDSMPMQEALAAYLDTRHRSGVGGGDPTARARSLGLRYVVIQVDLSLLPSALRNGGLHIHSGNSGFWDARLVGTAQIGKDLGAFTRNEMEIDPGSFGDHDPNKIYFLFDPGIAAMDMAHSPILHQELSGLASRTELHYLIELEEGLALIADKLRRPGCRWQDGDCLNYLQLPGSIPLWDLVAVKAGYHSERVKAILAVALGNDMNLVTARVMSGYQIPDLRLPPIGPSFPFAFRDYMTPFEAFAVADPIRPGTIEWDLYRRQLGAFDSLANSHLRHANFWLNFWGSTVRIALADGEVVIGKVNSLRYSETEPFMNYADPNAHDFMRAELVVQIADGSFRFVPLDPASRLPSGVSRIASIEIMEYRPNVLRPHGDPRLALSRPDLASREQRERFFRMLTTGPERNPPDRIVVIDADFR